eukprot:6932-Prorocentrum_minimum.AAC.3
MVTLACRNGLYGPLGSPQSRKPNGPSLRTAHLTVDDDKVDSGSHRRGLGAKASDSMVHGNTKNEVRKWNVSSGKHMLSKEAAPSKGSARRVGVQGTGERSLPSFVRLYGCLDVCPPLAAS